MNGLLKGRGRDETHVTHIQEVTQWGIFPQRIFSIYVSANILTKCIPDRWETGFLDWVWWLKNFNWKIKRSLLPPCLFSEAYCETRLHVAVATLFYSWFILRGRDAFWWFWDTWEQGGWILSGLLFPPSFPVWTPLCVNRCFSSSATLSSATRGQHEVNLFMKDRRNLSPFLRGKTQNVGRL